MVGLVSQVAGSFSTPATQDPSSAMMRRAFHDLGYPVEYLNLDISALRLGDAVTGARAMGWMGFLVGEPHKVSVVAHLDGLAESAALIGSATVAARRGDALVGENTEGWALVEGVEESMDLEHSRVVILGAGGAARAAAVEFARAGASHITIVNRRPARARQLAANLAGVEGLTVSVLGVEGRLRLPSTTDVLVNATSAGADYDPQPLMNLDYETLRPQMVVADYVPVLGGTALLKEAAALGAQTLDGIEIRARQGALAVRMWTNADADWTAMRAELEDSLARLA
ncbi:MAG: shikimate dehydrogenase [Actinobacteria bacterium]|nr:MAG: shikimate dehydrogenase [Actinomycetota bacterium]